MKFLLVTYTFGDSASGIMTKCIGEALARAGHEIHVLTSNYTESEYCKVHVCRPIIETESKFYRIGRKIYNSVFGDANEYHFLWQAKAVKYGVKLVRQEKIDVIYARSSPVEANLVSYRVGKITKIPVVQHFSDPYPTRFVTSNSLIRKLQAKGIRHALESARCVSFGNEVMLQQSLDEIGLARDGRYFVSPDPCKRNEFQNLPCVQKEKKVLVYLGGFSGQRDPNPLYAAVEQLNKDGIPVELHLYTYKPLNAVNLPACIVFKGRQDDITKALQEADVFVNLDVRWPDSPYISSKIKDYLSVNRPILSITIGESATKKFLNGYYAVETVDNDVKAIKEALIRLLSDDNSEVDYSERKNLINKYCSKFIAKQLIELVQNTQ